MRIAYNRSAPESVSNLKSQIKTLDALMKTKENIIHKREVTVSQTHIAVVSQELFGSDMILGPFVLKVLLLIASLS